MEKKGQRNSTLLALKVKADSPEPKHLLRVFIIMHVGFCQSFSESIEVEDIVCTLEMFTDYLLI